MNDVYPQITITPFRRTENAPVRYRKFRIDEPPPHNVPSDTINLIQPEAVSDDYNTPEDLVASFGSLLRTEYRLWIFQSLRDDKEITFSLGDALSFS
jgi:hypothetical protein